MTTSIAISIISLCLCISGFFVFRWYVARKTAASSLLTEYREEVYRLIANIDAATDRDSLLVEERIKTLKQILDDTDRRIAIYIRELQRSRNTGDMYTSLGRGIHAAPDLRPPAPEAKPPSAALRTMDDIESAIQPPAQAVIAAKKRSSKKTPIQPEKPKKKVQIAEMSAQGIPPSEIASRLGLSLAEVDLALNLLHRPV